jgi:hypothetical protein
MAAVVEVVAAAVATVVGGGRDRDNDRFEREPRW